MRTDQPSRAVASDERSGIRAYYEQAALTPRLSAEEEREYSARIGEANRTRGKLYDLVRPWLVKWSKEPKMQAIIELLGDVSPLELQKVMEEAKLEPGVEMRTDTDPDRSLLHASLDIAKEKIKLLNAMITTNNMVHTDRISALLEMIAVVEEKLIEVAKELADTALMDSIHTKEIVIHYGEKARDILRNANLLLVPYFCGSYLNKGLPKSVLLQEGNLGLIRAVETYDGTRGFRFSTYAGHWIRQVMDRALENQRGIIRMPVHVHELLESYRKQLAKLQNEQGTSLPEEEAFERLKLSQEDRETLRTAFTMQRTALLSEPIGDDLSLENLQEDNRIKSPVDYAVIEEEKNNIRQCLRFLSQRHGQIIRLLFGLDDGIPRTLEEVGEVFSLSRERIRQIEGQALVILNEAILRDRFHPKQLLSREALPYERIATRLKESYKNGHAYDFPEKIRASEGGSGKNREYPAY